MRRLMSTGMVAALFSLAVGAGGCAIESEDELTADEDVATDEGGDVDYLAPAPEPLAVNDEAALGAIDEGDDVDVVDLVADGHGSTESTIAPSCVKLVTNSWSWLSSKRVVKVRNDCSTTQRVGLDIRFEPDPACVTLAPGASSTWTWRTNKSLTKIKKC